MSEDLSRRRFLEGCAVLLGVSLVGCSSGAAEIQVASTGKDTWKLQNVPELKRGEAVTFNFISGEPGILFLARTGELAAVNAKCTHQGCTVEWTNEARSGAFHCPCHSSEFALDGQALNGPAKQPLKRYTAKSIGEGNYELLPKSYKS